MDNPFIPKRIVKKRYSLVEKYFAFIDKRRPSDRFLLYFFICTFLISASLIILDTNRANSVETPAVGGELREGIVGSPRFVNPVLAITRADQDMATLLFDGLLEVNADGELVPNIAQSITLSSDATIYNVVLREDVTFHDGTPLTADDVIFTIGLIQNPELKSPLQGNFNDVIVEKISEHEINFVLEEPYTPFIENLTVGILPHNEWKDLSVDQIPFSQHNTEPIGSGPYKIKSVKRNVSGLIDGYTLEAFEDHIYPPQIETITISFFTNEQALVSAIKEGEVDSATGLADFIDEIRSVRPDLVSTEAPLPRTFALFFNQNKSAALRQPEVRKILEAAINKDELVKVALSGGGIPATSPIPTGFEMRDSLASSTIASTSQGVLVDRLEANGWNKDNDGIWSKEIDGQETELRVDIATANLPFLAATAEYLQKVWGEIGVPVSIRQFEQSDLTQTVIRTRDYETLLFGTSVGRSLDFYPFWHSSQRNDPGLNVALYASITTDALLTKARTSTSTEIRAEAIDSFVNELNDTVPAIFLYVPTIMSIEPESLSKEPIKKMSAPHERFSNIEDWYIKTEFIWPIFNKN